MTEQSKRRIIGGVVLLLVAVALLPFLLRGGGSLDLSEEGSLDEFHTIPPAPEFNRLEVQQLAQPAEVEEIEQKLAEVKENRLRKEERQERREEAEEAAAIKKAQLEANGANGGPGNEAVEEERKQIRDSLDEIVFNEQGVPLRWVVQVVSYVDDDSRAKEFSQRLRKEEFPTMTREVINSKQQLVQVVYVGPLLSRSKAVEYKTRLDKTYKIESIIRPWN